jgi:soluble lytic murein transglycosylase-like protein
MRGLRTTFTLSVFLVSCASSDIPAPEFQVARHKAAKRTGPVAAARKPASAEAPQASGTPANDAVATSETANADAPVVPRQEQSITVTLNQVAKELNMSPTELRVQAFELDKYLTLGRLPSKSVCPRDLGSKESLCTLIREMRTKVLSRASDEDGGPENFGGGAIVPVRPHHFAAQQNMGYGRLMRSLSREPTERVLAWVPKMLEGRSCPRNLSAAAIRKLENMLPSREAQVAIEKLYEHAAVCLRPQDEGYHTTHFRQALLRNLWGNAAGARVAITRAAQSKPDNVETPRTLYWAGMLNTKASIRNQYWKKLVGEYPLSYHALEVWRHLKVDPYEVFTRRPHLELSRMAPSRADLEQSMRWLEALYLIDKQRSAQSLANWIMQSYGEEMPASTLMYLSALKSSQNTPLNAIVFLTRRVNENPEFLNEQTLRMLFPRPFMDVFHEKSDKIDPFLLMSIARQESGFNPKARSAANAMGLLQLLPSTARQMAGRPVRDLYDERTNVSLGVKYLDGLVRRFDSVELALAGYNAGPARVPTWKTRYPTDDPTLLIDLIPFKETRNYVSLIVRNNYWYEKLYRGEMDLLSGLAKTDPKLRAPASTAALDEKTRSTLVARLLDVN